MWKKKETYLEALSALTGVEPEYINLDSDILVLMSNLADYAEEMYQITMGEFRSPEVVTPLVEIPVDEVLYREIYITIGQELPNPGTFRLISPPWAEVALLRPVI